MDSRLDEVRDEALIAILSRRNPIGHREVLRRLHQMDDRRRAIVRQHGGTISQSLRDAVLSTQEQLCRNGCEVIRWFREYDLDSHAA